VKECGVAPAVKNLPSGIVTFVFTDMEGSTRLLRRLGDRYAEVLDRHRAVLRDAWDANGGSEVSSSGDSVFVAFDDAAAAARACADAQRQLAVEPWPDDAPVRVRMGVHTGLAAPRQDDYVALAVHQTARVMAAANGGQVLLSSDTALQMAPIDDFDVLSLGRFRLRDFEDDVHLFTLAGPGLPGDLPPVRAVPADGHNLVLPPTRFVGRLDEVDGVVELVQPRRLLTLTGPGGAGKTRLAAEAGLRLAATWPDGVWLVDLAPVQDPSQVGPAVAAAIGATASGDDAWTDVIEHLRARKAVVLLDSCEHLASACADAVERILGSCVGCGVVATSRESLGARSESVWRVNPLPLLTAVELFIERARRVRPDLVVDANVEATIREVCARLDGLPLALELAAARLTVLSPSEVLAGLEDRFRLLRSRNTEVPERQRTMKALLEWSDRLLGDDERTCLRRLALFAGGFSLVGAASAVADQVLDAGDVAELVFSLVDKSLVVADLRAEGTRYRLLESVRSFAHDALVEHGEAEAVARRLAAWYLDQLGPRKRHARGWSSAVAEELDNLRTLILLVASVDQEPAQELAYVVSRHLDSAHAYRDGIRELTEAVTELQAATPARVSLLTSLADLHLRTGDLAGAQGALDAAIALHATVGALPDWDDVAIDRTSGDLACRRGDNAAAIAAAERTLAGDLSPRGRARMWSQLGIASIAIGDLDKARRAFTEELEAYRALGDEGFQISAEGNLAEVALRTGDVAAAARHQGVCLELAMEVGASVMVAFSLIVAARIGAGDGAWELATRLHAHAESILDATDVALYDDDLRLSEEMLADARRALGEAGFEAEVASGRALDLASAASLGREVLTARTIGR
jgi:predicted ATPase/class 3 adenylate cyclase